jgi:hypothetical protein
MTIEPEEIKYVEEIAELVRQKECILFLGAGVHYPPPKSLTYTCGGQRYSYPKHQRPPLGSKLSKALARESGFLSEYPKDNKRNLQRVSLHYEIEKTRYGLIERIRDAIYENKEPSPVVRALAELDFPLVATTNYDHLFEKALRDASKEPFISIYNKNRNVVTVDYRGSVPTAKRPFLFKVHGDVMMGESIVITDEDYIDFVMRMSDKGVNNPVPETFIYFLKKWPTVFVGYSLMDYNLRLLFKTLRWIGDPALIPRTYSVDLKPDGLVYKVYSQPKGFVQFIVQDVWNFVPELYQKVKGKEMPL